LVFSRLVFPCAFAKHDGVSEESQYVRATPYSRNAEKVYIGAVKCQQDGSGIIVSLASFMCEKKTAKELPRVEPYRITIQPDVSHHEKN
jgi:hypothetical protein